MIDRYFAKVVSIQDKFTVVIDAGERRGVKLGERFLLVGLGETITDPETNEELERLEIVRGRVQVTHVQEKIATLRSYENERASDVKEIKKVSSRGVGLAAALYGPQDTVTELIKPGEERLKELSGAQVGDYAMRLPN